MDFTFVRQQCLLLRVIYQRVEKRVLHTALYTAIEKSTAQQKLQAETLHKLVLSSAHHQFIFCITNNTESLSSGAVSSRLPVAWLDRK